MTTPNEIWIGPVSPAKNAWVVKASGKVNEPKVNPVGNVLNVQVETPKGVMSRKQADAIRELIASLVEDGCLDPRCGQGIQYPTAHASDEFAPYMFYLRCWADDSKAKFEASMGLSSGAKWPNVSPPQASPQDQPSENPIEEVTPLVEEVEEVDDAEEAEVSEEVELCQCHDGCECPVDACDCEDG